MDLAKLIRHPELLDRETLYDLRGLLALYPYYQTARLLLLHNLFLLHDPTFNDELRSAALYITDRRVIFNLVEAGHYKIEDKGQGDGSTKTAATATAEAGSGQKKEDRTISLIDNFLDSIPQVEESEGKKKKRKPTVADAAVDYVAYLLATEDDQEGTKEDGSAPQMKGQDLIDNFINKERGKIQLKEEPEYKPDIDDTPQEAGSEGGEGYFTETLAKIYIKQARYEKALEIIKRLNANNPGKNSYYADQIRFLEKLILNSKNNK